MCSPGPGGINVSSVSFWNLMFNLKIHSNFAFYSVLYSCLFECFYFVLLWTWQIFNSIGISAKCVLLSVTLCIVFNTLLHNLCDSGSRGLGRSKSPSPSSLILQPWALQNNHLSTQSKNSPDRRLPRPFKPKASLIDTNLASKRNLYLLPSLLITQNLRLNDPNLYFWKVPLILVVSQNQILC